MKGKSKIQKYEPRQRKGTVVLSSIPEKPGLNPGLYNNTRTTPTSTFLSRTHWNTLQSPRSKPCGILMTSLSCTLLNHTKTTLYYSTCPSYQWEFSSLYAHPSPIHFLFSHIIRQILILLNCVCVCVCVRKRVRVCV